MKKLANMITSSRILFALLLLFFSTFSWPFYVLYGLCGFTDMIDGTVARKTGSESKAGAVLDSIADVVFLLIACYKIVPLFYRNLNAIFLYAVVVIAGIKILSYVVARIRFHRFISLHTILNKITGFALFVSVFFMKIASWKALAIFLCILASITALDELLCMLCMKQADYNVKSIFTIKRK